MANFTPQELEEILQQFFDVTGKRQYIGARYVPIFGRKNESSIEWDNSAPYEPLTIVLYLGNSYTSRTYVPAGVSIDDTYYWALTGNYNAQVEAYRQSVIQLENDFETLSDTIDEKLNRSYVALYGATENDPNVDWDSIMAEIAEVSDTVYFGSGVWDVGDGIVIPDEIKNVVGSGCTFVANRSVEKMLTTTYGRCRVSNINFDGNGYAKRQLYCSNSNRCQVINCNFTNIGRGNIGFENSYIGCVCIGCTFNVRCDAQFYGGVGIKTHTDNQIIGCKFFYLDYSILAYGANIGNCYFWSSTGVKGVIVAIEDYIAIGDVENPRPERSTYDIIFTNCEFDCIQTLVVNPRNVIVQNNHFYWNDRDLDENANVHLFALDSTATIYDNIIFSNNIIKVQVISYDVHSFGIMETFAATISTVKVRGYKSEGNLFNSVVYTANISTHYKLLAGFNSSTDHARSSSYPNVFLKQESPFNATMQFDDSSYTIETHDNFYRYSRIADERSMVVMEPTLRTGIRLWITVYYNEYKHDYLPFGPLYISKIYVRQSTPFEFTMRFLREIEMPSLETLTKVTTKLITTSDLNSQ